MSWSFKFSRAPMKLLPISAHTQPSPHTHPAASLTPCLLASSSQARRRPSRALFLSFSSGEAACDTCRHVQRLGHVAGGAARRR
eukprot:5971782-Pleurochrysis_carterae.AAC.1